MSLGIPHTRRMHFSRLVAQAYTLPTDHLVSVLKAPKGSITPLAKLASLRIVMNRPDGYAHIAVGQCYVPRRRAVRKAVGI